MERRKALPPATVLLAAAFDDDRLAMGHDHGLALSLVDQMLLVCNSRDWALRRYPTLDRCDGAQAAGLLGPSLNYGEEKVTVIDVNCEIGVRHDFRLYCSAPDVCCRWARYLFFDDAPAQP